MMVCFEMGVPYFSQAGHKAEGLRAVGILLPCASSWKREEGERGSRERDFACPCNRWMKCGPVCASGESRPELISVSRQGPREGTTGGAHPAAVDLPSRVLALNVRRVQRKGGERAGQSGKERKFIRGKREGDWSLRRTSVLPF